MKKERNKRACRGGTAWQVPQGDMPLDPFVVAGFTKLRGSIVFSGGKKAKDANTQT